MKPQNHEQQNNINEAISNNSPFDFTVDKATKTVTINMEFDSDVSMVWDAFTKAEIQGEIFSKQGRTVQQVGQL